MRIQLRKLHFVAFWKQHGERVLLNNTYILHKHVFHACFPTLLLSEFVFTPGFLPVSSFSSLFELLRRISAVYIINT
jgi:hypothetical protein